MPLNDPPVAVIVPDMFADVAYNEPLAVICAPFWEIKFRETFVIFDIGADVNTTFPDPTLDIFVPFAIPFPTTYIPDTKFVVLDTVNVVEEVVPVTK